MDIAVQRATLEIIIGRFHGPVEVEPCRDRTGRNEEEKA
jgi:hypothetical protein